jgi:hypothetical protein
VYQKILFVEKLSSFLRVFKKEVLLYFKTPFVLQGQVEPRGRQEVEQEESRFFGFRPWRHPQEEKGKIIMLRLRRNFSRLLVMVTSPIKRRIRKSKLFSCFILEGRLSSGRP